MLQEFRFNFAKFDSVTPDLKLIVDSAEILKVPRFQNSGQVTRAVHPFFPDKRIRTEFDLRKLRIIEISAAEACAAYTEFSRHSDRDKIQFFVDNKCLKSRDRDSDVSGIRLNFTVPDFFNGNVNRRLRNAVHVDQPGFRISVAKRLKKSRAQRVAAKNHIPERKSCVF